MVIFSINLTEKCLTNCWISVNGRGTDRYARMMHAVLMPIRCWYREQAPNRRQAVVNLFNWHKNMGISYLLKRKDCGRRAGFFPCHQIDSMRSRWCGVSPQAEPKTLKPPKDTIWGRFTCIWAVQLFM